MLCEEVGRAGEVGLRGVNREPLKAFDGAKHPSQRIGSRAVRCGLDGIGSGALDRRPLQVIPTAPVAAVASEAWVKAAAPTAQAVSAWAASVDPYAKASRQIGAQ